MPNLSRLALETLRTALLGEEGLGPRLYSLAMRDGVRPPEIGLANVVIRHLAAEVADEEPLRIFPLLSLYCQRLENRLDQRFSQFSGKVRIVVELRVSGHSLKSLEGDLDRLVEALQDVLGRHRGRWTDQLAYDGRLSVEFYPVKTGGKQYVQTAKAELDLLAHA